MTTTQSAPEGNNSEPLIISRPIGEPGRKTGRAGYNLEERSLLTSQEMKCLRATVERICGKLLDITKPYNSQPEKAIEKVIEECHDFHQCLAYYEDDWLLVVLIRQHLTTTNRKYKFEDWNIDGLVSRINQQRLGGLTAATSGGTGTLAEPDIASLGVEAIEGAPKESIGSNIITSQPSDKPHSSLPPADAPQPSDKPHSPLPLADAPQPESSTISTSTTSCVIDNAPTTGLDSSTFKSPDPISNQSGPPGRLSATVPHPHLHSLTHNLSQLTPGDQSSSELTSEEEEKQERARRINDRKGRATKQRNVTKSGVSKRAKRETTVRLEEPITKRPRRNNANY